MRFAFYMSDGVEQFVLTPETDTERRLVAKLADHGEDTELSIYRGTFYECAGGWVRQGRGDDSAIIVLRKMEDVKQDGADI